MKQSKSNMRYVTAVAIASFAALVSACGSSNGSAVAPGIGIGGIGGVGSQCAPLSQQMSFSGYAGYVDSSNLYAGTQIAGSAGSQYNSQLGLGSGGATAGNQWINTVMPPSFGNEPRTTSDLAYVGLNITSTGGYNTGAIPVGGTYTGYPTTGYPTTGTQGQTMIQGSFEFSQGAWAVLMSQFQYAQGGSYGYGGYSGYPTVGQTTLQNVTVCSIGINSGLYAWNTGNGQGTLFSGYISLTINGQPYTFKI
jgi:hypothetical protein